MRKYRKAKPEDDLEIAEISVQSWKFAYKGIMPDETLKSLDSQKRARERRDFLKENSLSTYICLESGKPVGFVDFEICRDKDCDKNVGEIWAIYISPEYIGKRIGKELFSSYSRDIN